MPDGGHERGHVIVLGNEKGGTGKSTSAMHLVIALMRDGYRVASLDLDAHQGTLTRYIENRRHFAEAKGVNLPMPTHHTLAASAADSVEFANAEDRVRLDGLAGALVSTHDFVVIDCPGHDTFLARHALSLADTLITPVNDSFIDMDLLAKVGGTPPRVLGPSTYSEIVWQQRQERARRRRPPIDWIVMRNRLAAVESKNRRAVRDALDQLASRIGFRLVEGFSERVIFRQLFLQGLTVLDLREEGVEMQMSISHVAARQEIRNLLEAILGQEPAGPGDLETAAADPAGAE
jgi:chromosome partitioning protein